MIFYQGSLTSSESSSEHEENSIYRITESGEEVLVLESFEGRYRVKTGKVEMLLQYLLGEER